MCRSIALPDHVYLPTCIAFLVCNAVSRRPGTPGDDAKVVELDSALEELPRLVGAELSVVDVPFSTVSPSPAVALASEAVVPELPAPSRNQIIYTDINEVG